MSYIVVNGVVVVVKDAEEAAEVLRSFREEAA
jgi:hypothetical protein